jgi:hypothetical protein
MEICQWTELRLCSRFSDDLEHPEWHYFLLYNILFGPPQLRNQLPLLHWEKTSGGELLEMRLLDKKWNRSFFYLPYVYQYLT